MEVKSEIHKAYVNQYASDSFSDTWRKIGAQGKAQRIMSIINNKTEIKNIIDIGSGDGSVLQALSEQGCISELYALEISDSAILKINDRNISNLKEIKKFDGYIIPYPDNYFDLATCSHVIEHVEHPRLLLREIKRVSKNQVFEIPIDFSLNVDKKLSYFLSFGHINIFTPQLFSFLLKSEGFKIIKQQNNLYSNDVYAFMSTGNAKKRAFYILKNIIKKLFLMKYRPDVFTVLTKSSSVVLDIF